MAVTERNLLMSAIDKFKEMITDPAVAQWQISYQHYGPGEVTVTVTLHPDLARQITSEVGKLYSQTIGYPPIS